jgi:RimJ/RimL family protein N-acetyltransferase
VTTSSADPRPPLPVRRLTPADAVAFRDIRLAGLAEAPRAFSADWAEEVQHDAAWFAARLVSSEVFGVDDSAVPRLLGVIGLAIPTNAKQAHQGHVWGVYVRPEVRGRGLASVLLAHAIGAAHGRVESLHLGVGTYNRAAIRAYAAAGFVQSGLHRRALRIGDEYIDEMAMTLQL